MRKIVGLTVASLLMATPALAAGRTLFYQYTWLGLPPSPERVLVMDSEAACDAALTSVLAGPLATVVREVGGTFVAGCR